MCLYTKNYDIEHLPSCAKIFKHRHRDQTHVREQRSKVGITSSPSLSHMIKATGLDWTTIVPIICRKRQLREDEKFTTLVQRRTARQDHGGERQCATRQAAGQKLGLLFDFLYMAISKQVIECFVHKIIIVACWGLVRLARRSGYFRERYNIVMLNNMQYVFRCFHDFFPTKVTWSANLLLTDTKPGDSSYFMVVPSDAVLLTSVQSASSWAS